MANLETDDIDEIIVTLELEDEGDVECEVICIFEYDGSDYAALTPTDESKAELYFFGIEMNEKPGDEVEMTLSNIEDDELLEELAEAFEQVMKDDDDEEDLEAALAAENEEASEDDTDDSRWDEFINKKLD
jgi:hypothetical protein